MTKTEQCERGGHVTSNDLLGVDEVEEENMRLAECFCTVGDPNGPEGIIEKVYRARGRGTNHLRAKVIMETGSVRYVPLWDVYER